MMSPTAIAQLARELAVKAAAYEVEPYQPVDVEEVDRWERFPFPNIGEYRPRGWCLVSSVLADKTGGGYESEPALTVRGLKAWCAECITKDETAAFAIIEEGQFQVVVGYFTEDGSGVECEPDDHEEYEIEWCEDCDQPYEAGEDYCPTCGTDLRDAPFSEKDRVIFQTEEGDEIEGVVEDVNRNLEEVVIVTDDDQVFEVDWESVKLKYNPENDPAQLGLPI